MASEPTDPSENGVRLPPELAEWFETHAAELDVEREVLLARLLAAYRTTVDGDASGDAEADIAVAVDRDRVAEIVRDVLAEREDGIDVEEPLEEIATRIDEVEADFQGKLEDVRSRVIQVKQEADAKAPTEHDHAAFDRLDALEDRIDSLETDLGELADDVESAASASALEELAGEVEASEAAVDDIDDRLADVEEKLQTVAWAISDLRDAQASAETDTVDRIKDAAARHDISRAVCQNCEEGVEIGLMTRAACPHCEAAVTTVEPASGFFGKPKLVTASQIEGDVADSRGDVSAPGGRGDRQ